MIYDELHDRYIQLLWFYATNIKVCCRVTNIDKVARNTK